MVQSFGHCAITVNSGNATMNAKKVKNVAVLIRVPQPLLKKLDAVAKKEDRSRSYLVVDAVKEAFAKRGASA